MRYLTQLPAHGAAASADCAVCRLSAPSVDARADAAAPAPPVVAAPAGLVAVPGNALVQLTWEPVNGATSYRVLRNGRAVAVPVSPAFTDTRLLNDTAYSYAVVAIVGGAESTASAAASATPAANIPGVPAEVTAQPADGAAVLRWEAVRGATSYRIYRDGVLVAQTLAASYRDTDLANGTEHGYHVTAMRSGVESGKSTPVSVTPLRAVNGR